MNQRGFTLIEVLIAITLLAIISLLVWQAAGTTFASKERFDTRYEIFQSAGLSLQQMTKELESAYLYSTPDFLGRSGAGEQRVKTVFIGSDEGDQDSLTFTTLTHVRYLKDSKESDQAEVSYFLEPDEESEQELWVLKKREQSPPDADSKEGGRTSILFKGISELNFRYFDSVKGEFVESWDSSSLDNINKLPRAVEILLIVQDPMDEEVTHRFLTTAFLGMAPGPNDF
ncbi:MAG: prepilin-type N-terminal cleavage/methylation domain-containing protein [Deltaproteobacteria bacterium]|nr:prepilin-type N-terminal cleavage/methylation domain-containing protein [Deltaproteobacteria bacterium]